MIASYLKPSLNSTNGIDRLRNDRGLLPQKKNENLIRPVIAALSFLMCILIVPEKPMNLASICEKHHSSVACQVW
tara:strand:+ start:2196 stop:2420 length:225 start_codon:yes stop_codon:yes gene_type:complete